MSSHGGPLNGGGGVGGGLTPSLGTSTIKNGTKRNLLHMEKRN